MGKASGEKKKIIKGKSGAVVWCLGFLQLTEKIGAALSGQKKSCGPPAQVPAQAIQISTYVYAKHRNPLFITNRE